MRIRDSRSFRSRAAASRRPSSANRRFDHAVPNASADGHDHGNGRRRGGPGARIDIQNSWPTSDAIRCDRDRTSIGDVSVGATLQLFNTFRDTMVGRQRAPRGERRDSVSAPASPPIATRLFDVATGYGQPGIEVGAASDLTFNRHVSATVLASYTAQLGTIDVARVPDPANLLLPLDEPGAGHVQRRQRASISIIPRFRLAGYFVIDGQYTFTTIGGRHVTSPATDRGQQLPRSATPPRRRSSSDSASHIRRPSSAIAAPRRLPFEVSFSHLETLTGNGRARAKDVSGSGRCSGCTSAVKSAAVRNEYRCKFGDRGSG